MKIKKLTQIVQYELKVEKSFIFGKIKLAHETIVKDNKFIKIRLSNSELISILFLRVLK